MSTTQRLKGRFRGSLNLWGSGVTANSSTPWIVASAQQRSTFMNLHFGTSVATTIASGAAMVDEADFIGCAAGAYIRASAFATITRNTFQVPDVDVSFSGVAAAYGAYMHGSSGFIFEENSFTGPGNGAEEPTVGAVFRSIGPESNVYYNNTFNAFTSSSGQSAGTIIMGNNDGPEEDDGLQIKCNDYSLISPNDFDVAFTGVSVKIGEEQGANIAQTDPAGNTFAPNCSGSQHFHNNEEDMAEFTYYHHEILSTTLQIVPVCASDPIEVSGVGSWYEETTHEYVKELVCPSYLGLMQGMGELFEEVTEAIEASSSFSAEPGAYAMKAAAVHRLTGMALRSVHVGSLDTAVVIHAQAPLVTSMNVLVGLYMAQGQLEEARELVDAALEEDPEAVYWLVADPYLAKLEEDQDPLSAAGLIGVLSDLAATDQYGSGHASAWLSALGVEEPEVIILPYMGAKRYTEVSVPQQPATLKVHPNPSQGLVHFTAAVPGGVNGAILRILDVTGQVVGEKRTTGDDLLLSWDLQLPAGTYYAALIIGETPVGRTKFLLLP